MNETISNAKDYDINLHWLPSNTKKKIQKNTFQQKIFRILYALNN